MPPAASAPIERITPGMRVLDPAGTELGQVVAVQPGDPNAVTAQRPPSGPGVLAGKVPHPADTEPHLPADLAARLLRTGYLRISRTGHPDDQYVGADQIIRVAEGAVTVAPPDDWRG